MVEEKPPKKMMHRVLVVDDDHDLAVLLSEVLTFENCEVDIAANGLEAMDRLRTGNYDAVLCDLMMPRVDGQALYEDVTREYPHLTGHFLFVTGQPSRRAGFTEFVSRTRNGLIEKPFDIQQLRLAIREVLQR